MVDLSNDPEIDVSDEVHERFFGDLYHDPQDVVDYLDLLEGTEEDGVERLQRALLTETDLSQFLSEILTAPYEYKRNALIFSLDPQSLDKAVQGLIWLAETPEMEARVTALRTLGYCNTEAAAIYLSSQLEVSEGVDLKAAIFAIGLCADFSQPALEKLKVHSMSQDPSVSVLAFWAAGEIQRKHEIPGQQIHFDRLCEAASTLYRAYDSFVEKHQDKPSAILKNLDLLLDTIPKYETEAGRAVPLLLEMLREVGNRRITGVASMALRKIPDAIPALVAVVAKEKKYNKQRASLTLSAMGEAAAIAVSPLLEHKQKSVRFEAAETLRMIGPEAIVVMDQIGAGLKDSDPSIVCECTDALYRFGLEASDYFPQFLVGMYSDNASLSRMSLVAAAHMARLDPDSFEAELLKHKTRIIRLASKQNRLEEGREFACKIVNRYGLSDEIDHEDAPF